MSYVMDILHVMRIICTHRESDLYGRLVKAGGFEAIIATMSCVWHAVGIEKYTTARPKPERTKNRSVLEGELNKKKYGIHCRSIV